MLVPFIARYAYLILPAGKSLDLNFIHNQAKHLGPQNEGFNRNQGYGAWEINLAGFLSDLNTNYWKYDYDTRLGSSSIANSFLDALALVRYRYDTNYNKLKSVANFLGPRAAQAFRTDLIDGYADKDPTRPVSLPGEDNPTLPWPGADSLNHFFDEQGFFDPAKSSIAFTNRLHQAMKGTNTYDQSTFIRLLSQLTTDSDPEPDRVTVHGVTYPKINLNFANSGTNSATNFLAWRPEDFFTNVADRLLLDEFGRDQNGNPFLSTTNIPISPTNFYTPAVHRLLQVAANLYDATTNSIYPSVFQPEFKTAGNKTFISGYRYDTDAASIPAFNARNTNGIPMVIGAKKGFPNFNEVSLSSIVQAMRKLELPRRNNNFGTRPYETNQMFLLTVSNLFGVESWNSYHTNLYPGGYYPRELTLAVGNTLTATLTNQAGLKLVTMTATNAANTVIPANTWLNANALANSFKVPLLTNVVMLTNAIYRSRSPERFDNLTNIFETGAGFPTPHLFLTVSNRLNYTLLEGNRIVDYVILNNVTNTMDVTRDLITVADARALAASEEPDSVGRCWQTNRVGNSSSVLAPTLGVINQMQIAMGNLGVSLSDWNSFSLQSISGQDKEKAIQFFKGYIGGSNAQYFADNRLPAPGLRHQAPFSPTRKLFQVTSWQVNDPVVHYMLEDLKDSTNNTVVRLVKPTSSAPTNSNLGILNDRYRPWGGNPRKDPASDRNAFLAAVKDPGVKQSDDWDFPTNKFPHLGDMGRVHRGTAWQTIYLKSDVAAKERWQLVSLYPVTHPTNDWKIVDLFTVAPHPNAARGQLSVNQTNLAAWSAVLSGVLALTNTTPHSSLGISNNVPPQFEKVWMEANTPPLHQIVAGINRTRQQHLNPDGSAGIFNRMGYLLSVPELTMKSPFLNQATDLEQNFSLNDAAIERIPQQILSLLKAGEPRFVIYAFGQSLKPAERSIVTSGPAEFIRLCTNYQITGEVVTRSVVHFVGDPVGAPKAKPPIPPRVGVVVDSFNNMPAE